MEQSTIRNFNELGVNLRKIVQLLMANDDLVKLLYYNDTNDPLSQRNLTTEEKNQLIFNKLIKLVPRLDPTEVDQSKIALMARKSTTIGANNEFHSLLITIEIFVPTSQWLIAGTNLRPYAIMGEIQKSLNGKHINGLGKLSGGDFEYNFGSDEMTGFMQTFSLTEYD